MNTQVLAVLIQTAGQIFSEQLRNRNIQKQLAGGSTIEDFFKESDARFAPFVELKEGPVHIPQSTGAQTLNINITEPIADGEAEAIATGCVPCSLGHFTTCTGILNEANRFVDQGLGSKEVADRITACLAELNALERIDLRPEMITQLNGEEKQLAQKALKVSRNTRHILEDIKTPEALEKVAAYMQSNQRDIGRKWIGLKVKELSPEDREEVNRALEAKLKQWEEEQ